MCYNLNMTKYFKIIIKEAPLLFSALLIFLVPILFSSFFLTYNNFTLIKTSFLWSGSAILLFLTLIKFIIFNYRIPSFKGKYFWLLLIIFLFFNTFFVASDLNLAIFGDYDRRFGLITYLSFLLFFFLLFINLKLSDNFNKTVKYLLGVITFSALLISIYGILQYLGLDIYNWQEPVYRTRIISSLGQPNFLASFLLLSLGSSIAFYTLSLNIYWRIYTILVIFLQLIALVLTDSRGAWLSLIIVIFLSIFLFFKTKRKILFFKTILFTLLLIIFSIYFLPNNQFINRLQTFSDFSSGSILARQEFYKAAISAWDKKKLFGYGLEHGGEILVYYYQPDWAVFMLVNDYPDRAHNIILDILLNFGLLGLIIFIFLVINVIYLLFLKKKLSQFKPWFLVLCLGLLAYFISLLFSFPSISTSLLSWSILAILMSYSLNNYSQLNFRFNNSNIKKIFLSFLLILNLFLIIFIVNNSLKNIKADNLFFKCRLSLANQSLSGINYCFLALDKASDPVIKNYYTNFINNYLIDNYVLFPEELKKDFYGFLENNYSIINNNNYSSLLTKAKTACFLEKENWQAEYNQVINRSPRRPFIYQNKANCYFILKKYNQAILNYNKALNLLPSIYDDRLNEDHYRALNYYRYLLFFGLGQSYSQIGDYQLAISKYLKAYNSFPNDFSVWRQIAWANYYLGNLSEAIYNYLYLLENDIINNEDLLIISNWYQELGDYEEANYYYNLLND